MRPGERLILLLHLLLARSERLLDRGQGAQHFLLDLAGLQARNGRARAHDLRVRDTVAVLLRLHRVVHRLHHGPQRIAQFGDRGVHIARFFAAVLREGARHTVPVALTHAERLPPCSCTGTPSVACRCQRCSSDEICSAERSGRSKAWRESAVRMLPSVSSTSPTSSTCPSTVRRARPCAGVGRPRPAPPGIATSGGGPCAPAGTLSVPPAGAGGFSVLRSSVNLRKNMG
jgi:hypothetical protein